MRLVRVAVPVPALDSLTYSVPDEFPMPPIGARVLVPLGSRVMTGCRASRLAPGPGLATRRLGDSDSTTVRRLGTRLRNSTRLGTSSRAGRRSCSAELREHAEHASREP